MKTYKITITEILQKELEINAESRLEAIGKAKAMYSSGTVVLSADDFEDVKIK